MPPIPDAAIEAIRRAEQIRAFDRTRQGCGLAPGWPPPLDIYPPVNHAVTRSPVRHGGNAMYTSLGQAAKAAGVSRSAIMRAIRAHRISAGKTDTGDWQIDPAELHRVFSPITATAPERHDTALQAKIDALREVQC